MIVYMVDEKGQTWKLSDIKKCTVVDDTNRGVIINESSLGLDVVWQTFEEIDSDAS